MEEFYNYVNTYDGVTNNDGTPIPEQDIVNQKLDFINNINTEIKKFIDENTLIVPDYFKTYDDSVTKGEKFSEMNKRVIIELYKYMNSVTYNNIIEVLINHEQNTNPSNVELYFNKVKGTERMTTLIEKRIQQKMIQTKYILGEYHIGNYGN